MTTISSTPRQKTSETGHDAGTPHREDALDIKSSPLQPTAALVQDYLNKWKTLDKYVHQEEALNRLFQELCPSNDDRLAILLKVSALNDFYTTNIYDTHSVAAHILALNCDGRIAEGDASLVNEMALVRVGGKERNFFSFASKYCNHHHQEPFPIFDSYVEKMLLHFRNADGFVEFKKQDLRQYRQFVEIIRLFRRHYKLEQFSLREIDIYLWLAGKEAFGPAGEKKKARANQKPETKHSHP